MDMVDFNPIEDGEEDQTLQDFFPEQVPYHLQHLIEYRIKLLLKNDALHTDPPSDHISRKINFTSFSPKLPSYIAFCRPGVPNECTNPLVAKF